MCTIAGAIENHQQLSVELMPAGYNFLAEHNDLPAKVWAVTELLNGAYGMIVIDSGSPGELITASPGSPLVVSIGIGEHFVVSDQWALLSVTNRFVVLEEGSMALIIMGKLIAIDRWGKPKNRLGIVSDTPHNANTKQSFNHYKPKDISYLHAEVDTAE